MANKVIQLSDGTNNLYPRAAAVHRVTFSSVSSLPQTKTDALVLANMELAGYEVSNPAAMLSNFTVTPANGSVTISGTISGTTNIILRLAYDF